MKFVMMRDELPFRAQPYEKAGNARIRLCTDVDDFRAWDAFLFHFSGAHCFQTYGWLRSYEPMGFSPHLLVYEQNGAITGGVAFLSAKIPLLPLRIYIIPHGPLPSDPTSPSWFPLMQGLDEVCRRDGIYAQIYPHEPSDRFVVSGRLDELGFTSPALFTAHQFSTEPVTVDLRGRTEGDVLASVRERTRTYIRRAICSGLELRTEMNDSTFDLVYRLFLKHAQSRGFLPRPYKSLRLAWEWFSQRGWATVIQAWWAGQLVGANFLLFTGRTAFYIHGAVNRASAAMRPAEFLHWHGIRIAMQLGLDRYDFVNWGPPGVAQFKRGFRPTHHAWHPPKTKVYRPATARVVGVAGWYLRPVLRSVARYRAARRRPRPY